MADDEDGGVTVDQVKQEGGGKKPSKAKVVVVEVCHDGFYLSPSSCR